MKNKLKGQALIESVLVFPVLILFLLCFIQIAVLFNAYYIVNYASFCGCRSAIVHSELPDVPSEYARKAALIVMASMQKIEAAATQVNTKFYNYELEVSVIFPVKTIVPGLNLFLPYIPVTASTRLPVER